jgi:spore coat polysaccharide biosynthesis predicted glycosyltransferase SpsG
MAEYLQVKYIVIGDSYVENLLLGWNLDYQVVAQESEVIGVFNAFQPQTIVFDLLSLQNEALKAVINSVFTISLSPIFNCLAQMDLVFHRSKILGKDWLLKLQNTMIRNGLSYTVINQACHRIPTEVFEKNLSFKELSIAVSMGGTDAANKTLQVLNVIKQSQCKLLIWVMLGEGYGHSYQELVTSMKGSPHEIILAKSNTSMWRVLSTCSLAILSGGVTAYEAVYAGLPSINLLGNNWNAFLIDELIENEVSLRIGENFPEGLSLLDRTLVDLARNRHKLLEMHKKTKGLIDSMGAQRIVEEIQAFYEKKQRELKASPLFA